jgi:hypothetical protein
MSDWIETEKFIEQLSVDTGISKEDLTMYAIYVFRDWCEKRKKDASLSGIIASETMLVEDLKFLVSATKTIQEYDEK